MTRFALSLFLFSVQLAIASPMLVSVPLQHALISFPLPDEKSTVYDENNNGVPDMIGDTWVFDHNGDGHADLIIRFRQTHTLTAEIYDDTNVNGRVDYQIGLTEIQILESHWRVQITTRDGTWVLPDGSPNWNLDLQADSGFTLRSLPLIAIVGKCQFADDTAAIALADSTNDPRFGPDALDGQPDFQTRYWDLNKDGIPDYEWRNINSRGRNDLQVINTDADLRYKVTHRFPPLETLFGVDWNSARLTYINSLIPSYTNEAGYFLSFNHTTSPNQINSAFENPFAFYDLHGNHDCNSELRLRAVTETVDRTRNNLITYNQVRYTWAQDTEAMQYRLYLIGQAYADAVWQYPAYPVAHVGYADLPAFVLDHAWRGASFAEVEPGMKSVSFIEGIYENLFYTPSLPALILGNRNQNLPPRYLPLYLNLREEYNLTTFNSKPVLYFSSIDRRLHLTGAQQGVVIFTADTSNPASGADFSQKALTTGELSISSETVYADTDADGYIDTWTYRENGQNIEQLVIRPGVALLAAKDSIRVKKLSESVAVSAWQAVPPADTPSWKSLEAQLAPAQAGRRLLNDLFGIFADLPGDLVTLPNTSLTSVSAQKHGLYAAIITLGVDPPSTPTFLSTGKLAAGNYVLHAQDGFFSLENPAPRVLELSALVLNPPPSEKVNGLVGLLSFSIKNRGNADITVHIHVSDTVSRSTILFDQDKTIPAAGDVDFSLPWAPALPGTHKLIAQLDAETQGNYPSIHVSQQLGLQANVPDFAASAIFVTQPYTGVTVALILLLIGFVTAGSWAALKVFEKNDEINNE